MDASVSGHINFKTPNPENIFDLSDGGNIAVTNNASSVKTSQSENSRNSLFKSFTFEQNTCYTETEKCIAFWKSVMEKNLKPIKCSIIENKKKPSKQLEDEDTSTKCREEVEKAVQAIHVKYKDLWDNMVKELQKKKLSEVKLIGKAKCILCDTLASNKECLCRAPKNPIKKEVKKLNEWKSASAPLRKDKREEDPVKIARKKVAVDKSYDQKYKFVDILNEKKMGRLYEHWRRSRRCKCCIPDCTCAAAEVTFSAEHVPILESKAPSLVEVQIEDLDVSHKSEQPISNMMIPSELRYQKVTSQINTNDKPPLISSSHVSSGNVDMSEFVLKMIKSDKYSDTMLLAPKSSSNEIDIKEEKKEEPSDSCKNDVESKSKQKNNSSQLIPLEELLWDSDEPVVIESNVRLYLSKDNHSNRSLSAKRGMSILKYTEHEHGIDFHELAEMHRQAKQEDFTPKNYHIVVRKDSLEMARYRLSFVKNEETSNTDIHNKGE